MFENIPDMDYDGKADKPLPMPQAVDSPDDET